MINHIGLRFLLRLSTTLLALAVFAGGFSCTKMPQSTLDTAWWEADYPLAQPAYKGWDRYSQYVEMPDGVKIAITYYLPKGLEAGKKIPAILHQTRYMREVHFRWPLESIAGQMEQELIDRFTAQGYAYVNVDVRGAGASFGTRPYPWSEEETTDGARIVDWIIAQPWSNGLVGTEGVSYAGTTAEMLLINKHPAVKAAAIRFGVYDIYADIAYPGGVLNQWFVETWSGLNEGLDENDLGKAVGWYGKLGTYGVKPVDEDPEGVLLQKAVAEHKDNYSPAELARKGPFSDDKTTAGATYDKFSPYSYRKETCDSKTAILSYSGWFDGAYGHATIKRYLALKDCLDIRLIMGPWPHDGLQQLIPFDITHKPDFDQVGEVIRFMDYHLKGIDRGVSTEPTVHYYTMGEEKWKTADSWPPASEPMNIYFGPKGTLTRLKETDPGAFDNYKVDMTATSGPNSRWVSLVNIYGVTIQYPDRKKQDRKLLVYDSMPLTEDTEVTGHPIVTLFAESTAPDGIFIVYLEDVDEKGNVAYVTEGMLNAPHRKLSDETPPYPMLVPYRTYKRVDALPMIPGQIAELKFDLQPVSYMFKKGHRIRVAISGADAFHFPLPEGEPPSWKIYRSGLYPSGMELPVIPR